MQQTPSTLAAMNQHSQWQLTRSEQVISLTLWPQNIFGSYSQLAAVKKKKENELFTSAFTPSGSSLSLRAAGHRTDARSAPWTCLRLLPAQHRDGLLLISSRPGPPQPGSSHLAAAGSTDGSELHLTPPQTPPSCIWLTWDILGLWHFRPLSHRKYQLSRPFCHLGPLPQSWGC